MHTSIFAVENVKNFPNHETQQSQTFFVIFTFLDFPGSCHPIQIFGAKIETHRRSSRAECGGIGAGNFTKIFSYGRKYK